MIAANYTLITATDRPFVYLEGPDGCRLAELFVLSGVQTQAGLDDATSMNAWTVTRHPDEVVISLNASSSIWDRKTYRFRCQEQRLLYEIEVYGRGCLTEVDYFGGYCSAMTRWGSGRFWSGRHFTRGFNPEPTVAETYEFGPSEGAAIDLCGVPSPGKESWFFTPPPFCFAFETPAGWLGMGIEASAGHNRYTDFRYRTQEAGFHLSLAFEGHTNVDGYGLLPAVGIDFGADPYEVLGSHTASLRRQGHAPNLHRPKAAWWSEPILCGWGAQCYEAAREGGHAPDYARQHLYEQFLEVLEGRALSPGIVVLDDKWQATYGENRADETKWPNLEGFVARQHAAGRKVLLWLKAWDPEGVPPQECVTNAAGLPIAVDPTHPSYQARLRASVRTMLSADGYDADGFKIDFSARIPSGPGLRRHGDVWGLELMKAYLGIIYDEAKRTKPDALVMTHAPHPYLADVVDMIRLNDINTGKDVCAAMTHRARLARIACPDALIDTDNWPMPDKATWRTYLSLQPDLGVPSLYYVSHIDSTLEALQHDDYELIREMWRQHRRARQCADLLDGTVDGMLVAAREEAPAAR
ncbi:MAG TPA: hypothetical protein VF171_01760 [Trueperaceae bacterium]